MIDNNEIYKLGLEYNHYPDKWSQVRKALLEQHGIEMTNNAIRKRFNRYKKSLRRYIPKDTELFEQLSEWLENRANAGMGNTGILPNKPANPPHTPDYETVVEFTAENVLVIPDLHLPFAAKGWLDFILRTRDRYKCETVLSIGDILDQCALSQWVSDPDGLSSGYEIEKAVKEVQRLYEHVPDMMICLGNHDVRHMKAAMKAQLSTRYLRHMNEILNVDWEWHWNFVQKSNSGDVLYTHGDEKGGAYSAQNISKDQGMNTVVGHTHSNAGIQWFRTYTKTWFSLNVGCLLDDTSYALAYGKKNTYKGINGIGLVLSNGETPLFIRYNGNL